MKKCYKLMKKEREREMICFIQEANFHIIGKQLLILLSTSHVVSRNSASTFLLGCTVGVNSKPVQNTRYRLIQPISVST